MDEPDDAHQKEIKMVATWFLCVNGDCMYSQVLGDIQANCIFTN